MVVAKITDRDVFARLWCDPDVTYSELLTQFDVSSYNTLYCAARRFGLPPAGQINRKSPPSGLAGVDVSAIRKRYQAGDKVADIAAVLPISPKGVYQMIKRNGWVRCAINSARHPAVIRCKPRKNLAALTIAGLSADQIEALRRTGGKYAELQRLGARWGKSEREMQISWHRVRAL